MPTLRREKAKTESPLEHNQAIFDRLDDEDISLYDFVRKFWPVIEPGKKFVDGKHIEAICKHLESVTNGSILRLLVNIAPRHAKSSIISVLWRVWSWIRRPWLRWLCSSYALSLSIRDNRKCRRLILSKEFQALYGHIFKLEKGQNTKIMFENSRLGSSQATSVGSSSTGEGGDILLIDDCHAIDEKRSDISCEAAIDWFRDTWYTRRNDPQRSAMVVVGQRVRADDVSGFILSGETGESWVHLNLPTEFEPDSPCVTHHDDGSFCWQDWRKLEGELLWPERFPEEVLKRAKRRHGPVGFAALYQQRPVPAGGNIFNIGNERLFTIDCEAGLYLLETPRGIKPVPIADCWHCTTSDVAAKAKEQNDYTVFSTWAVTPTLDVLLLDVKRDHWPIPEQKEQGYKVYLEFNGDTYQALYFEDVGYQGAIGQELIALGVPCLPFNPTVSGDKVLRAGAASIWQRLGKLYFIKFAEWLAELRKELYGFPKEKHDDQVDTVSMIVLIVRKPVPMSDNKALDEDVPPPAEETGGLIPLTQPFHSDVPVPIAPVKEIDPFEYADRVWGGDQW
jgi:predicted phage terminase large subunit-like protein